MNKPCEHCNKADTAKSGFFKCDSPCDRARQCFESLQKLADAIEYGIPIKEMELVLGNVSMRRR